MGESPTIAATPIIKIPVPKKNDDAIDIPKYFLNRVLKQWIYLRLDLILIVIQ